MAPGIRSQDDFDSYIQKLPEKEPCTFKTGIELELCTNRDFACPYQGTDTYSLSSGMKKECRRKRILQLKKLF